jgi:NADH-quinone oxidoreductase subunit G
MPKLTINDIEVEVEQGTSIIQAAEQLGVEIPRFCYHDKLTVPANCRMCLVEVEGGPPKPVASCAMACGEGMVVKTESDMVKKARKGVMEMLLINHPLDCPICDQGGECDLQDQAVGFGFDRSRFHENKRAVPDKDFGPLVGTKMTRCINCTRCIRFVDEIAGTPVLGQVNRGEESEISTFTGEVLDTELSGNLVDICPVGALTSKPYTFNARPWELKKTDSIDVHDALGSNIRVDARGREVLRIQPRLNEEINEEWISDRTRYAYDGLNKARLDRPYIRDEKNGKLKEASWDEAFDVIAEKLSTIKPENMAALAGDLTDVESMVALKDMMAGLGSSHVDCRTDGSQITYEKRGDYIFNAGIAGIEDADAILLIGVNPRIEATMVNARIRKAWMENKVKVALIADEEYDLTYPYAYMGNSPKDLEKLLKSKEIKSAKNPMVIVGAGAFAREDGAEIQKLAMLAAQTFKASYNVLHNAASRVGGLDVGFVPKGQDDKSFSEIVAGTKTGAVKFLYMVGADEFDAYKQIGWKSFVVYQGHHGDHAAMRADVILPGSAYTEKDGMYVNTEGRVQMARRAVTPPGDAKEDWKILRALSERLGKALPYDTRAQLLDRIMTEFPHLSDIDQLPEEKVSKVAAADKIKVDKAAFRPMVANYYLSNAICRASDTMRQCVQEFVERKAFLEAAE